jgi:hypothetical protein
MKLDLIKSQRSSLTEFDQRGYGYGYDKTANESWREQNQKGESKDSIIPHQLTLASISCCGPSSICWYGCTSYSLTMREAPQRSVGLT